MTKTMNDKEINEFLCKTLNSDFKGFSQNSDVMYLKHDGHYSVIPNYVKDDSFCLKTVKDYKLGMSYRKNGGAMVWRTNQPDNIYLTKNRNLNKAILLCLIKILEN